MLKFLGPSYTFSFFNKLTKILFYLFLASIFFGLIQSLFISPIDYIQGHSVRIMYVHVPSSWISLACFSFIGFLSILSFIFKNKIFLIICRCVAPIGALFTIISLVTGSLWGQPTWGTWWAWDARLASMLLLAFFYFIYILSYKFISNKILAERISCFIAIVGLINIPIIKYSVEWWSTLHQASSVKILSTSTVHYSMLLPLMIMFFSLIIYSALIFLMKYRTKVIKIKSKGISRL